MASNQLIANLQNEISLLNQLNDLLAAEKTCLIARDYPALETISFNKQNLSATLEQAARQRMELLGATQNPKIALEQFLKQCNAEQVTLIQQLNASLAEKLTECRDKNTVNGQVISANLHLRREIISELNSLEGNPQTNLYTSSGMIKPQDNIERHEEV